MRGFLVLCCTLLVLEQACAVTIRTVPAGALVADQYGELGTTGQPLIMRPPESYAGVVELVITAPGYRPFRRGIPWTELSRSEYPTPDQPPIYLEPASPSAYLAYYRGTLTLVSLGLILGGLAFWRLRKREARVNQVVALLDRDATAQMVEQMPGKLGPYQVLSKLGGGGMATVYLALDPSGQKVALKLLHHEADQDADFEQRFRREAKLYAALQHPHIVSMLDYGQEGELLYLVLELMEGGTLGQRIPPEGLPPAEVAKIMKPLGEAIQAAHDGGVVHRDLKPDNVMLTGQGKLKVTDFGLGRSLTSTHLTASGTALGTPAYMSPEQITGTLFEPATDQYALGVIAFELLTGKLPFTAVDPIQICFMHVSEAPPAPGINPEVDAVILRMLAKKPEERYATVEDAVRALLKALG